MSPPRATLVCDGSSDRTLRAILGWLCAEHGQPFLPIEWANPALTGSGGGTLRQRLETAIDQYPCDLLFVHRDAEGQAHGTRVAEIATATEGLAGASCIPVVPVRMTEAWLLFDEPAIRYAADNPSGQVELQLPRTRSLESMPDPKAALHDALLRAANLPARRRRAWRIPARVHIVAERVRDFSPLRALPAFQHLESAVATLLPRWDAAARRFEGP